MKQKLSINMTMKKVIDEMEKGKESTQILQNILNQRPRLFKVEDDYFKELDHHCMVALTSCVNSLAMMRSCDFNNNNNNNNNKMGDFDVNDSLDNTKEKRGCYKRRKIGETREEVMTQLQDDGFGWRKYGQKVILKANHPRNYYRCTHKHDKNCLATKQVQQISENPIKYKIIYHGDHICNHNILNQSQIVIEDNSIEEHSSSTFILNFSQKNQMKQECNSPSSGIFNCQEQSTTTTLVSEQSDLISRADNIFVWDDLDVLQDYSKYFP